MDEINPHQDDQPRRPQAPIIAIDDGYAQIKLVGENTAGRLVKLRLPTIIRPARAGSVVNLDGDVVGMYKTSEGESFVCNEKIKGEETRFPDFHISQMNRVIVNHALNVAGYGGQKITLLTSLPVDEYFMDGSINRARIAAKTENLKSPVESMPPGRPMPKIHDVKVGCQAISAYFDMAFDNDGAERTENLDAVAVVDIGGSTTDIAVVLGGETIDNSISGTARIGILDLHRDLASRLSQKFGFEPNNMDDILRAKSIKAWGEKHDVSAIVEESIAAISSQIEREISRRIGTAGNIDRVLFVGGGACVFGGLIKHWRNAMVVDDPEFANARGLLKYAKHYS
jgi:plasmid segregation protein ParM